MHMKVSFEAKNYLLNRYPDSFADLVAQIEEKTKRSLGRAFECCFVDKDGDRIMVGEDADLLNVREVCRLEGKDVCKLAVELPDSHSRPESPSSHSQHCVDGARYLAFLKKNLPAVQEDFARCFAQGMPCEECLGQGKTADSGKCENCYGRGVRPLTRQMKIIMQYIDLRFQQLLLAPLETFMASDFKDIERASRGRDSSTSLEDVGKPENKRPAKAEHGHPGQIFFGRETPVDQGFVPSRKQSHRDDFNKPPPDD